MLIRKAAIINRDQIKQNSQGKANRKKEGDRVVFKTNKALIIIATNRNETLQTENHYIIQI
tara:strand:+ start:2026 stop:2208 length:183 start_codon:yes stop_codon:yes gene_type:complete